LTISDLGRPSFQEGAKPQLAIIVLVAPKMRIKHKIIECKGQEALPRASKFYALFLSVDAVLTH